MNIKKLINSIALIYIIFYIFKAPIQYYMNIGIVINFIKIGIPILMLFLCLLQIMKKERYIYKGIVPFAILILLSIMVAIFNNLPVLQIALGLKSVMPLMAYFLYIVYFKPNINYVGMYRCLMPIVVFGLLMDKYISLPWAGSTYLVGDTEREVSREWVASGIERLSGFQSANFDSGTILMLLILFRFICLFVYNRRMNLYDFLLLVLGSYGIYITTFKTAYLFLVGLFIISFLFKLRKYSKLFSILTRLFMLVFLAYCIVPPLISISGVDLNLIFFNNRGIENFLFNSFIDRLLNTWPRSVSLLTGTFAGGFWGRGLGGIGVAQQFTEPLVYSPADNFFVYAYVSIGFISFLLFGWFLKIILFYKNKISQEYLIFTTLLLILNCGATLDFVDSNFLMLSTGIILGNYCVSERKICTSSYVYNENKKAKVKKIVQSFI